MGTSILLPRARISSGRTPSLCSPPVDTFQELDGVAASVILTTYQPTSLPAYQPTSLRFYVTPGSMIAWPDQIPPRLQCFNWPCFCPIHNNNLTLSGGKARRRSSCQSECCCSALFWVSFVLTVSSRLSALSALSASSICNTHLLM